MNFNYRLDKRCDVLQDTELLQDVTKELCQGDAMEGKKGKCMFEVKKGK